jgi:hypothetical protein
MCMPVRGLKSAAEPRHNGGWAASYELRTFSAGAPHNWCTAADENLSYISCLHFLTQKVMSPVSWNSNVFCPELSTKGPILPLPKQ